MPHFVCLCAALSLPVAMTSLTFDRVELPVTSRLSLPARTNLGACTIETRAGESGVTVTIRTRTATAPEPAHEVNFSVPAVDLPLRPGWGLRNEGEGLIDALSYDGTDVRFELRALVNPRRAIVFELAVDAGLSRVRGLRITEYAGAEPGVDPVNARLECESALN